MKAPSWTSTLRQCCCCQQVKNLSLDSLFCPSSCPPVDLEAFKSYLAEKEYSVENLDFYVWFTTYRRKFESLPEDQKTASPELNTILKLREQIIEGLLDKQIRFAPIRAPDYSSSIDGLTVPERAYSVPLGRLWQCDGTKLSPYELDSLSEPFLSTGSINRVEGESTLLFTEFQISGGQCDSIEHRNDENDDEKITTCPSLATIFPVMSNPQPSTIFLPEGNKTRPLEEDVDFAIVNFLTVGSHKELNLDETIRERVTGYSKLTTHPSIFLEVFRKVDFHLNTVSLPNFVESSQLEKQLQKRCLRFRCSLASSLVGIILFMTARMRDLHRFWALVSVPFVFLGQLGLFFSMSGFWTVMFRRFYGETDYWSMGTEESHVVVIPVTNPLEHYKCPPDDDDSVVLWKSNLKPPRRKKTLQQRIERHCFIFTITDTTLMVLLILFA